MFKLYSSFLLLHLLRPHTGFAEKSTDIGYFWHITDFHHDPWYGRKLDEKDYYLGEYDQGCWTEKRGTFGDYNCDAPDTLIKSAVEFITDFNETKFNLEDNPSFIFWTGDNTAHAENSFFNETLVLDSIDFIVKQLVSTGKIVFPVLGNHDVHEKNQMPEGEDYYTKYKDILEQFPRLNQSSILQDIQQKGGYFSVGPDTNIIDFKLRIIGLNSNLWYQSNHLVSDKPDPADQFRNFEEELKSARENKERVLIFSHIPPGKFERFYQKMTEVDYSGYHWMYERFNKRYLNIIQEFWDIIELQLFAHHHTDSFKVFRGLNGTPISVGLVAPGLTPWNSTLAPETGANNPGLRLFKYSKNDGRVLDFSQFYLNLTQANEIGKAYWELEYSFLDFYNISDLSALSVASLLERMKTDDKLFNQYYSLNTVMFESEKDAEENCDATCRRYHYCAQSELDYSSFETCISSTSKGDSPSISIELISAFVLDVFLVFNSYSKIFL